MATVVIAMMDVTGDEAAGRPAGVAMEIRSDTDMEADGITSDAIMVGNYIGNHWEELHARAVAEALDVQNAEDPIVVAHDSYDHVKADKPVADAAPLRLVNADGTGLVN